MAQQMFLSLILRGMYSEEARKQVGIKTGTVDIWEKDDGFSGVASFVMAHRALYQGEALKIFVGNLEVKAQEVLDTVITKGLKWDELEKADKGFVLQAVNMVTRRFGEAGNPKFGPGTYEEVIARKFTKSQ